MSRDHRPCLRRCVRGGSLLAADDLLRDRSPPSSASAGASSPLLLGHFRVHHCTTFFCLHFRRAFFPTLGARPTVSPARASPLRRAKLEGSRLQLELFQIGLGMQQRDSQYVRARVENGAKSARQLAVLTFFVCVYGG